MSAIAENWHGSDLSVLRLLENNGVVGMNLRFVTISCKAIIGDEPFAQIVFDTTTYLQELGHALFAAMRKAVMGVFDHG